MNKDKGENKEQSGTCERERDEYLNGWKRAKADLLNYKKEENERLKRAYERGETDVMEDMVGVADSMDQSLQNTGEHIGREGIELIRKQLVNVFLRHNVTELVPKAGEPFDPRMHEAIAVEEKDSPGGETETIAHIARTGYRYKERLLRPAQVVVAKRKEKE